MKLFKILRAVSQVPELLGLAENRHRAGVIEDLFQGTTVALALGLGMELKKQMPGVERLRPTFGDHVVAEVREGGGERLRMRVRVRENEEARVRQLMCAIYLSFY